MACAIPKKMKILVGSFLRDGRRLFRNRSNQLSSVEQMKSMPVDYRYALCVVLCSGAVSILVRVLGSSSEPVDASCWFCFVCLSDSCLSPIRTWCFRYCSCLSYLSLRCCGSSDKAPLLKSGALLGVAQRNHCSAVSL